MDNPLVLLEVVIALILALLITVAPLGIWTECRRIRRLLEKGETRKTLFQECYNIRKRLDKLISLIQGGDDAARDSTR